MSPAFRDDFLIWVLGNEFVTSSGAPFEFYEHEFALDPLTDTHPHIAINKCAQVGLSEMFLLRTLFLAHKQGLNIGYTLHSSKAMADFGKTKLDPILAANPTLNAFIDGTALKKSVVHYDAAGIERQRFIHFVGAYNPEASSRKEGTGVGISFSADILIHDEASRSDQYVLDQLKSRLLDSKYRYRWLFDNPSYPGFGADKVYQQSDQRHWFVKCERCGHKQYLDWFVLDKHPWTFSNHCFIDPDRKIFVCGGCGKELTDNSRRGGEWVPKWRGKTDYRGYWINQMCYIRHNAKELLEYERGADAMTPSVFSNMVLGKPYIGSDVAVSRQMLEQNIQLGRPDPKRGQVAMGVDQGREKQWVLGDKYGIFDYGRTDSWQEILRIRDIYDAYIVMDSEPEDYPTVICRKLPNKAWRANFRAENLQTELVKFSPKSDKTLVLIRREEMFDEIFRKISQGEFPINMHINKLSEMVEEFRNLIRATEEDTNGNVKPKWVKTGVTDLPFAVMYWETAMRMITKSGSTMVEYAGKPKPEIPRSHGQILIEQMTKETK